MKKIVILVSVLCISFTSYSQTVYIPSGTSGISPSSNGNVGIGVGTPTKKLEVIGDIKVTEDVYVNYSSYSESSNGNNVGNLILFGDGGNGAGWQSAIRWSGMDGFNPTGGVRTNAEITVADVSSYGIADLVFKTKGSLDDLMPTEKMRITKNGNIGIGTTNPQVNADITTRASAMLLPNNSGSTNTGILRIGYFDHSWAGVQLDMGIYNDHSYGYPGWIQARNPTDYSINRNLLLNPNGGNVGIGINNPDSKLVVNGLIRSEEVKVEIINGPDYVFNNDYELRTLQETKEYIAKNKHLPEIPSAQEMETNGVELGEMNMRLLKKIEELTLYQIELMEEMEAMKKELRELKK